MWVHFMWSFLLLSDKLNQDLETQKSEQEQRGHGQVTGTPITHAHSFYFKFEKKKTTTRRIRLLLLLLLLRLSKVTKNPSVKMKPSREDLVAYVWDTGRQSMPSGFRNLVQHWIFCRLRI